MLTGEDFRTPTQILLQKTNTLSVQQMIAYHTLTMTYKILHSLKPTYLSNKIKFNHNTGISTRGRKFELSNTNYKMNQCREGFVHRAITLFNRLDEHIKTANRLQVFKNEARKWVLENIQIKPKR